MSAANYGRFERAWEEVLGSIGRRAGYTFSSGKAPCPCGLPGGQHKLQCSRRPDRQAVVTAREEG